MSRSEKVSADWLKGSMTHDWLKWERKGYFIKRNKKKCLKLPEFQF